MIIIQILVGENKKRQLVGFLAIHVAKHKVYRVAPSATGSVSLFVLAAKKEVEEENEERLGSCGAEEKRCYAWLELMQSGLKCPVEQQRWLKKNPEWFVESDNLSFSALRQQQQQEGWETRGCLLYFPSCRTDISVGWVHRHHFLI